MADYWVLVISYWIHLLATVIWLGGLALLVLVAWPALRQEAVASNQWLDLQKRFIPWANGSLVVLLITGFVQMTHDTNYEGFLVIDSLWAGAMLAKHVAFGGMVLIGAYLQWSLYPAMDRLALLRSQRPAAAAQSGAALQQRELRLLRLNMACAVAVLLLTAMATAV